MLLDLTKELPPLTNEEVRQVFMNTLDLITGFSILFVQCSPAEANQLIPRVRRELPDRKIEVLELEEPIDNLYRLVESRADQSSLNVLFVRGLEKSLEDDIKPGYQGLGDYYNLNTVPPILSHLNQQRENFRDHFGNICFVFVLPRFAIRYFVRRAPDFYDWNSGVFNITDFLAVLPQKFEQKEKQSSGGITVDISQEKLQKIFVIGNDLYQSGRYEEAIRLYDDLLSIDFDSSFYEVWVNRAACLDHLGRYEAAIDSYNNALKINSKDPLCWNNRGVTLDKIGR